MLNIIQLIKTVRITMTITLILIVVARKGDQIKRPILCRQKLWACVHACAVVEDVEILTPLSSLRSVKLIRLLASPSAISFTTSSLRKTGFLLGAADWVGDGEAVAHTPVRAVILSSY